MGCLSSKESKQTQSKSPKNPIVVNPNFLKGNTDNLQQHLKPALSARRPILKLSQNQNNQSFKNEHQCGIYKVLRIKQQTDLGLLIFEFFDLRELIFLGLVSKLFYDLVGNKELITRFNTRNAKLQTLQKKSSDHLTLSDIYLVTNGKKKSNEQGQGSQSNEKSMNSNVQTQNFYIYANEISIQFNGEQINPGQKRRQSQKVTPQKNIYFTQQSNHQLGEQEKYSSNQSQLESQSNFNGTAQFAAGTLSNVFDTNHLNHQPSNYNSSNPPHAITPKFSQSFKFSENISPDFKTLEH